MQGVGFRYTARHLAFRYPVTGFVRNLVDGSVELVAEGNNESVELLLKDILESNLGRYIHDVSVSREESKEGYDSFEIRF